MRDSELLDRLHKEAKALCVSPLPQTNAERVVEILRRSSLSDDDEVCHAVEDALMLAALESIANDPYTDPKALARTVLETRSTNFKRHCA